MVRTGKRIARTGRWPDKLRHNSTCASANANANATTASWDDGPDEGEVALRVYRIPLNYVFHAATGSSRGRMGPRLDLCRRDHGDPARHAIAIQVPITFRHGRVARPLSGRQTCGGGIINDLVAKGRPCVQE